MLTSQGMSRRDALYPTACQYTVPEWISRATWGQVTAQVQITDHAGVMVLTLSLAPVCRRRSSRPALLIPCYKHPSMRGCQLLDPGVTSGSGRI